MCGTWRVWAWLVVLAGGAGCGEDASSSCVFGARICRDDTIWVCGADGAFTVERACPGGTDCIEGLCQSPLVPDEDTRDALDASDVVPDTQVVDTKVVDTQVVDTRVEDTRPPVDTTADTVTEDTVLTVDTQADTATPDTIEPADTFVDTQVADALADAIPDTQIADTQVVDTFEVKDVVVPEAAPGMLGYERVSNIAIVDDLTRVVWEPGGAYAFVAGGKGDIGLVRPGEGLVRLGKVGTSLADISIFETIDGYELLVLDTVQGLLRVKPNATLDGLTTPVVVVLPNGSGRALAVEPGGARVAIGAYGTDYISYLYTWDPVAGLSSVKGMNAGAGISDLMWGSTAIYGGSANLVTTHGRNGADSKTWVLATDLVVANGWSPGFGNAGAAAWRPDPAAADGLGTYGVVSGWSSNKLYVYDGSWRMGTLPVPTGAGPQGIAWKRDGTRALVVGRVIGNPAYAVVIEHRPLGAGWTESFVDQSIPQFTSPPWSGNNSSQYLLDVAWRPGTACDEGLIVGADSGSSFSPTFGYVIRFRDLDDPACD